jgi:hypothetical protein
MQLPLPLFFLKLPFHATSTTKHAMHWTEISLVVTVLLGVGARGYLRLLG